MHENDHIYSGDRVRITTGPHSGRTGTVKAAYGQTYARAYDIEMDGTGVGRADLIGVRAVEKLQPAQPAAAPGDRVRITQGFRGDSQVGVTGILRTIDRHYDGRPRYIVDPDGAEPGYPRGKYGAAVEKIDHLPKSTPEPEPAPEILVDAKRLQAAQAAHQIVGSDALLDDLIGVAEFILGEHSRAAVVETLNVPLATPPAAPATDHAADRRATSDTLYLSGLEARYDGTTGDVVEVENCYLKPADVDRLIAFLQASQRRFAREN